MELCERVSSYLKPVSIVTLLFEFIRGVREFRRIFIYVHVLHCIIWNLQQHHFAEEINYFKTNLQIKISFKSLGLFTDKVKNFYLLRIGGRLENASKPKDRKHPIFLPNCNFVVDYMRHLTYIHNWPLRPFCQDY